MPFDDILLPLRVGFGAHGGPSFSTRIVTLDNGAEQRLQDWSQARRRFDARTGLHRPADIAALLAFFHARAGRARGFRLRDWTDWTSAADGVSSPAFSDQNIGTGSGATKIFQLRKRYASGGVIHDRDIRKPVAGRVWIGLGGAAQASGWTVDNATGLVTFAAAPGAGVAVTAGFEFDVPCRFDTDQLNIRADDLRLASAEIPLIEIRV
ncbi:MAG: DUF2460 domain-containing protein [Alphaproteobacteria bacterium]|nr:MAG: DUF2460 domain-containing protein [Alphaproteobacteria bacterium]